MNIASEELAEIQIYFSSGTNTPPPYHHQYRIQLRPTAEGLDVDYELAYLHREEISEDEIVSEGFSENDDWQWAGSLNESWLLSLNEMIDKHSWPKQPLRPSEEEPSLLLRLLDKEGNKLFDGIPADAESWMYFAQELIQALYETAGREAPWVMEYIEKSKQDVQLLMQIEAHFSTRSVHVRKEENGRSTERILDWQDLKNLMKVIYLPDYLPDQAHDNLPKKGGKFLNTGEGFWYELGVSVKEPSKKSKTIPRLEETLKGLA